LERHQSEKAISCDVLAITFADKAPQRQNKIELKKHGQLIYWTTAKVKNKQLINNVTDIWLVADYNN